MDQDTSSSDWLRVLLSAFFSRMHTVLLATLACAVVAGLSSYLLPEVYTGGFSIIIKAPEIDRSSFDDNADITIRPGSIGSNVISDEFHILRSEGLAGAVAQAFGVGAPLPRGYLRSVLPFGYFQFKLPDWLTNMGRSQTGETTATQEEALSAYFLENLVITPQLKSDIITVTMNHHDRRFLKKTLNLYASEYLSYRKKIWFNEDAEDFFGDQASKSLHEWNALSEELLTLKSNFHKIDPSLERAEIEERISGNLAQLQVLNMQLNQYTEQLSILNALNPQDAITFFNEKTKDNRLFWQLKIDIGEAKANRQELLKDHMENSPLVKKSNLQLQGLYNEYKLLIASLIKNSLSMLITERNALINNNDVNSERMIELDRMAQQINVIEKRIKLFERQYEVYENKALTIAVQSQSRNALGTAVRIVSPPSVRSTPIWPNRSALIIVAAILGFFLTLIAVVSVWMMKDSFHFPEDVTGYLGLPVLTSFALESGLDDDYDSPGRAPPAELLEPADQEVPASRARPMGYALLVFLSMGVAGWVIGTTLWPVWKEYQEANALPNQFGTAIRLPAPAPSKDDIALVTANSVTPAGQAASRDRTKARPYAATQAPPETTKPVPTNKTGKPTTASAQGEESDKVVSPADVTASVESAPALLPKVNLAVFGLPSSNHDAQGKSAHKAPSKPLMRYFVQFGSFQNRYRAEALRDKLAQQGYAVRIPTITSKASGLQWFSVRADFEELDKATEARNVFLTQGGPRPVLGKH